MERKIHSYNGLPQEASIHPICRLCGAQTFKPIVSAPDWLLESDELFAVYECTNCGLGETRPPLSPEALAQHYPQDKYTPYHMPAELNQPQILKIIRDISAKALQRHLISPTLSSWVKSNFVNLLPIARWRGSKLPYTEHPGTLLDVGCADGYFLRKAHAEGWTCTGIEMTPGLADELVASKIADIFYGRFEDIELDPARKFDIITMWHVLEHFENPVPVMEKCYDLIEDDGLLIIAIPIRSAFEEALWGRYWGAWDLPRHQSHFNRKAIDKIFAKTGFDIVQLTYELTSNNWIHSFNHWQSHHGRALQASRKSILLQVAMLPLAILLKWTRQSGRVIIHAKKRK